MDLFKVKSWVLGLKVSDLFVVFFFVSIEIDLIDKYLYTNIENWDLRTKSQRFI